MSRQMWVVLLFWVILFIVSGSTLGSQLMTKAPASLKTKLTQVTQLVQSSPSPMSTSAATVLGVQTKSGGCEAQQALPDAACTPGAIFSNVTKDQICQSGYSQSVRNVPESEKEAVFSEYGITSHTAGEYEVDHLISLELGGSNDISNLWPEAANPQPGFHEKDKVENYLHKQVCDGVISLQQAQEEIRNNWLAVYQVMPQ